LPSLVLLPSDFRKAQVPNSKCSIKHILHTDVIQTSPRDANCEPQAERSHRQSAFLSHMRSGRYKIPNRESRLRDSAKMSCRDVSGVRATRMMRFQSSSFCAKRCTSSRLRIELSKICLPLSAARTFLLLRRLVIDSLAVEEVSELGSSNSVPGSRHNADHVLQTNRL
jgi:hypothetical protein